MTSNTIDWLVQEVSDLLDSASVGIYEFVWLLRGAGFDLSEDQMITCSAEALERLLDDDSNQLIWLRWPSEAEVDEALPTTLGPRAWSSPTLKENYLAIKRT